MFFDELERSIRRSWVSILVWALLLGALGAGYARTRPVVYRSTAVTTIGVSYPAASVDVMQNVATTINITMPALAAQADSDGVAHAAAGAAGLPREQAAASLHTAREPDSTVISWSFTADQADHAQAGLQAATTAYAQIISGGGPKSDKGQPLIQVVTTAPARPGVMQRPSALLWGGVGLTLGALIGFAIALVRGSGRKLVTDRDSIELATSLPVLASLDSEATSRGRAWDFVVAYLERQGLTGAVVVLASGSGPSPSDLRALAARLDGHAGPGRGDRLIPLGFQDPALAGEVAQAGAVIVVLASGVDDLRDLAPELDGVRSLCRGPVVAALESARPRPTRRVGVGRRAAARRG